MLWITNFEIKSDLFINKRIIHGHSVEDLRKIQDCIKNNSRIIPLDNGCYLKRAVNKGNLLCVELDTLELFVQKNIEE